MPAGRLKIPEEAIIAAPTTNIFVLVISSQSRLIHKSVTTPSGRNRNAMRGAQLN